MARGQAGPVEDTEPARDDWWHLLAALPAYIVVHGVVSGGTGLSPSTAVLVVPLLGFLLAYPVAMWGDVRHVRGLPADWRPRRSVHAVLVVAVLATFGVASFVVTPVYLYRRHVHVGTP